jgi:hypothetical protein
MVFRTLLGRRYNVYNIKVSNSKKTISPMTDEIVALMIAWIIVVVCFIIENKK